MKKISILLITLMVVSVGFLSGCNEQENSNDSTEQENSNDLFEDSTAYEMSKEFMLDSLKAPATAQFPPNSEAHIKEVNPNEWVILSYVDAENSFGALIRIYYSCEMTDSGETWLLKSLSTGDSISEVQYKWGYVTQFSGKDDKITDTFTINGDKWRIDWNTGAREDYSINVFSCSIWVYSVSSEKSICWVFPDDSYSSGSKEIYDIVNLDFAGAGEYYLDVSEVNLDEWDIKIYEGINLIEY